VSALLSSIGLGVLVKDGAELVGLCMLVDVVLSMKETKRP
jgi:hypothetical protein